MPKLIWLDVETTGLNAKYDSLLEVAVATADFEKPFEISDVRSWVLRYDWLPDRAGRLIHPIVVEMHTKNGLWDACRDPQALSLFDVEAALLDMFPCVEDKAEGYILAGSSVHFDMSFLREDMPFFAGRFSHRLYDVTAIKLFCRSLGMPKLPKSEAHRAAADIRESVEHARLCTDWLKQWGYNRTHFGQR